MKYDVRFDTALQVMSSIHVPYETCAETSITEQMTIFQLDIKRLL